MTQEAASHTGRPLFWNAVGTAVEGAVTAKELLEVADLDWTVSKQAIQTMDGRRIPDRFSLERSDTMESLGIVSDRYQEIQNAEALDVLDSVVASGDAKYEAGWSLKGGGTVGVTAKLPDGVSVAGDDHDVYLLLRTSHTGRGGLELYVASIRLACTNMVNQAIRGAKSRYTIPHIGSVQGKIQEAREALGVTFTYVDAYKELGEELSSLEMTDAKLDMFLEELLDNRGERASETDETGIRSLFEGSETLDGVPMNGYRFVQAVGEWYDWGREVRTEEARFIGTTTGLAARQRQRATDMALATV